MDQDQINNAIDRYILGQMTQEESLDFKYKITQDLELTERINLHLDLLRALDKNATAFRSNLEKINNDYSLEKIHPAEKTRSFPIWMQIAAGFALMVSAIWIYARFSKPNLSTLFDQYFVAPTSLSPELTGIRGMDSASTLSSSDSILGKIDEYYINQKIADALRLLSSIPEQTKSPKMYYQEGILFIIKGDARSALVSFDKAKGYLPEEVKWMSAMAYLKMGDVAGCERRLKEIPKESRFYGKAGELIAKLK